MKRGRAHSQVSIQISSSCRSVVSDASAFQFLLRNPSWLCQCHVMTISVKTRCQYEVRLSEQCIIHSTTGLGRNILCWPACYQDLLLTHLRSPALRDWSVVGDTHICAHLCWCVYVALILHSAWLIQQLLCYYVVPTDIDTRAHSEPHTHIPINNEHRVQAHCSLSNQDG